MNYRTAVLLNHETATTATTKVVDINLSEIISRITIQFKGTNNGATPTACPAAMVSKIELVDGSDVLFSLSGAEAQALNILEAGKMDYEELTYVDDNICVLLTHINFGRWLWDEDFALNPNNYKNLQLKITHNKACGGSAPDAGTLFISADVFDEKQVIPKGFLMAKEHYNYSLTSNANEYIDLPTDYSIRKVLILSLYAGKQPWEQYNTLKLVENDGQKVVIDSQKVSDLIKTQPGNDYFTSLLRTNLTTSSVTYYVVPTYDVKLTGIPMAGAATSVGAGYSYGGTVSLIGEAAADADFIVRGKAPHGALCLPFGDQDIPSDWYDVSKLRNLKLDITAGSSVGSNSTAQIVVQQARMY